MMFSLEIYLDTLEQDIQNSHPHKSSMVMDNSIKSPYIRLSSWVNPFEF